MGFSTARRWLFSSKVPHILATMVTTATGKQMTNEEKVETHFYTHTQITKTNGLIFYADSKCSDKGPMTYRGMIMDHNRKRT